MAEAIAGWDVGASEGGLFDDSHQLSKLIGRPTTPLSVAAANALRGQAASGRFPHEQRPPKPTSIIFLTYTAAATAALRGRGFPRGL